MASSSFTPNLGLSNWSESDRPQRADFVSDNTIIDDALGGHIADTDIHLTAAQKAFVLAPYGTYVYAGTGEASRSITLGYTPKFVFVFKRSAPLTVVSGGVTVVNAAMGAYGNGASSGVAVTSSGVVITHEAEAANGKRLALNDNGSQYTIIAFR